MLRPALRQAGIRNPSQERTFVEVIEKSVLALCLDIEVSSAPRIGKGGTYEERVDIVETRRHGSGDTTVAIFRLENRRPAAWREKHRLPSPTRSSLSQTKSWSARTKCRFRGDAAGA